ATARGSGTVSDPPSLSGRRVSGNRALAAPGQDFSAPPTPGKIPKKTALPTAMRREKRFPTPVPVPGGRPTAAVDEQALLFAARYIDHARGTERRPCGAPPRDRRRAIDVADWFDHHLHEAIDLQSAADLAGVSPFHFLRLFSSVVGVTPHQYLLRARLRHAA